MIVVQFTRAIFTYFLSVISNKKKKFILHVILVKRLALSKAKWFHLEDKRCVASSSVLRDFNGRILEFTNNYCLQTIEVMYAPLKLEKIENNST